jgi:ParB-like chromosome segregation protein Spo0J
MEPEAVWMELACLKVGLSPRERQVDPGHVAALAELQGQWPPILVARCDGTVIDGYHRAAAARSIGWSKLPAFLFDGTADDAFVEAVRRNVEHGLPLTIEERKAAARRMLAAHSDWSDRRIAEVCALSGRTLARLRAAAGYRTDNGEQRVCRDGRSRPAQPESTRLRILDAVQANPEASLRAIAQTVGTSPETVRRVRQDLNQQEIRGPAPERAGALKPATFIAPTRPDPLSVESRLPWAADPAITSTPDGTQFADWFDRTDVAVNWRTYVMALPLSRVYEIADEARRRARAWNEFADVVEERVRRSRAM